MTLRNEKGEEDTYSVGPDFTRFSELQVGDMVKMTYYESLVLQIRNSGQPGRSTLDAAATAGKGSLPGGTAAVLQQTTVTVKAIDLSVPLITVSTSDGRTVTRKVEDRSKLEGVKAGDRIDITYTSALLTSVERSK